MLLPLQSNPFVSRRILTGVCEDAMWMGGGCMWLHWKCNTEPVYRKGQHRLCFLRKRRSFNMCSRMLPIFSAVCQDRDCRNSDKPEENVGKGWVEWGLYTAHPWGERESFIKPLLALMYLCGFRLASVSITHEIQACTRQEPGTSITSRMVGSRRPGGLLHTVSSVTIHNNPVASPVEPWCCFPLTFAWLISSWLQINARLGQTAWRGIVEVAFKIRQPSAILVFW